MAELTNLEVNIASHTEFKGSGKQIQHQTLETFEPIQPVLR